MIAEDDTDISDLVKLYLESSGYRVLTACDGREALALIENEKIDLAVLDIMMPGIDGYEVTRRIRVNHSFPIIFLSAKNQDNDKILGLNLGADDYMTKPFNPLELIARVNSNLRRFYQLNSTSSEGAKENRKLRNGTIVLDTERMTVEKDGEELAFTPTELKILMLLMKNPGHVFTKKQIYEYINGDFYETDENSVIVHISRIREKLGDDSKSPEYIINIRGLGYKIDKK